MSTSGRDAISSMKAWPLVLAAALLLPAAALATNGYFSNGYGIRSQGTGGVGIALPQDALAAAANPAGTGDIGDRVDLGLTLFIPKRSADIASNAFGPDASYDGGGKKYFLIPDIGYARRINEHTAVGIALYGNGGMNTDYKSNPYSRFGSTGRAGVDLEQLFVTPSIAWTPVAAHTFGAALNFAYQRFSARGLGAFATTTPPGPFSVAPGDLTDRGNDSSTGWGVRLGWLGRFTPALTIGATWASKTKTGNFDKYRGLFAESGGFDIPSNYGLGISFKASPALTLAADIQRIEYSEVKSVGNSLALLLAGNPLGSDDGPGFGWKNVTVGKVGVLYNADPDLVLRAGYGHASQPIPSSETFLNILAPATVQDHVTFGATWKISKGELSAFYAHAFRKTVNGSGSIPPGFPPRGFGGGEANIRLEENIIGVGWTWKL